MSMNLDTSLLRQFSTETFSALLRQIQGEKDLVLESNLMKSLDKICGMALLKSCGVKRIFKLEQEANISLSSSNVVYFIWADMGLTKRVINQTKANPNAGSLVYAIFVPFAPRSIHRLLEEEGVWTSIKVLEFSWQFIPRDSELMSLEMPRLFQSLICQQTLTFLKCLSKTLLGVETLYGRIPNKFAIGRKSKAILSQLEILEQNTPLDKKDSEIGQLIVLDRDYDMTSALLSPVTYEALLDEVFGIKGGIIDFSEYFKKRNTEVESKLSSVQLDLSIRDKIFDHIRFKHFSTIFPYLSNVAKQVRQSKSKAENMNVNEMKEFVQQNLKDLHLQSKSVSQHIDASEIIQSEKGFFYGDVLPLEQELVHGGGVKDVLSYLEMSIAQQVPIEVTLRLFSLASITQNGFSSTDFNKMKKLILESYGYKHLNTLATLERIGMLKNKSNPVMNNDLPQFSQMASKLDLIPKAAGASSDLSPEREPAFVFNGIYTPLVCRIARILIENPSQLASLMTSNVIPNCSQISSPDRVSGKNMLVFFVGGYSLAEVAALKALQALTGYRIFIGGTHNITGASVIRDIINMS